MEHTVIVDLGQAGSDVEIEVDICDEYVHDYVTRDDCEHWATSHFEECVDVDEYVFQHMSDNFGVMQYYARIYNDLNEEDRLELAAKILAEEESDD